jgi:hypothetical protein
MGRGAGRLPGGSPDWAKPLGSERRPEFVTDSEATHPAPDSTPRALSGDREEGAALILTVIVLTILIVLVVQFAFSVNRETVIVRNTQDDAAMELAARGITPWIEALFAEDRANGAPGGDLDTLADLPFDPQAESARQIKVGEVDLTFTAEDAERRFPLPWLASSDEKKAEWAKAVLIRLITKLEIEGDAEAMADAIKDKIQTLADAAKSGPINGAPAPQPGAQPGEEGIQLRVLLSIDQLLDEPAPAADPADPNASGQPAAPPTGGAATQGGIDRLTLFGQKPDEEKGIEGKKGLAPYVTTWDTAGININTALPEVLFAILPEKDKTRPEPKNLWESADEIVDAIREHRIDPDYAGSATPSDDPAAAPSGGAAAGTGQQGASRQWSGSAFEKGEELQNSEIHEKLGAIFTKPEGQAQGGQGNQGDGALAPAPNTGGGGGGASGGAGQGEGEEEETYEFQKLLVVKSRIYFLRVDAEMSSDVKNSYRIVLTRSKKDEIRILMVEEVAQ